MVTISRKRKKGILMLFLKGEGREDPKMELIIRSDLNNSIINNLILS